MDAWAVLTLRGLQRSSHKPLVQYGAPQNYTCEADTGTADALELTSFWDVGFPRRLPETWEVPPKPRQELTHLGGVSEEALTSRCLFRRTYEWVDLFWVGGCTSVLMGKYT